MMKISFIYVDPEKQTENKIKNVTKVKKNIFSLVINEIKLKSDVEWKI